ncbi:Prophage integrase IntA [Klebsiella pasteurii]|nr:Prophage integrase IntA [Klebsiella pasteurii]
MSTVVGSVHTEDYAEDIWRSLERDVFPAIGNIGVTDIKAHVLVQAVQPVQASFLMKSLPAIHLT